MDTDNERDTHFQNFAKLLLDEMIENFNGSLVLLKDGHEGDRNENVTIIARRMYDLAVHTFKTVNPYLLDGFSSTEEIVRSIPDMTSFPD